MYSSIVININGLYIMVTLCIYFEHNKFYVNYLLNILCPYYNFIQAILLYFLQLFQMTFIIYILYYIFLYSKWKQLQQNFQNTLGKLQVVIFLITPLKHEKKDDFFQESKFDVIHLYFKPLKQSLAF
jgi:hypothetical protein